MFKIKANTMFNHGNPNCLIINSMHDQMTRLYLAAKTLRGIEGPSAVARLMNVSPQTLNNWEAEDRGISNEGLLKAQESIGCDAIWLRDGTGHMMGGAGDVNADEMIELLALYQQSTSKGRDMILDLARSAAKRGVLRWGRTSNK